MLTRGSLHERRMGAACRQGTVRQRLSAVAENDSFADGELVQNLMHVFCSLLRLRTF